MGTQHMIIATIATYTSTITRAGQDIYDVLAAMADARQDDRAWQDRIRMIMMAAENMSITDLCRRHGIAITIIPDASMGRV